jgi:hypothetical protein
MGFDQKKYIQEYRKEHKKQFNVDLNKDEYEELVKLLKEKDMTKVEFIRKSIEWLKEK